ncbi:MAG TPA: zinc ribbon domain-containing protein [Dehalococcoidia bacterium]|nr:zinc ribbon domain-containing protein [Dehalococcoidia bacterium]
MPLYEYYCDKCDEIFESVQPISKSDEAVACPDCGQAADRIMPTTFATMSKRQGLKERVPFHHHDVREEQPKRAIARVKPKSAPARNSKTGKRTKKG